MSCFDENQALRYVEGLLAAEEERALEAHAAGCPDCRWLLNEAGRAVLYEASSLAVTRQAPAPAGAAAADDGDRVGEVLAGTYRIERFIGRGGMGSVYEASHLRLPRRFAVKFLLPPHCRHPEACTRIKREAEVTSRLSHPNIVEVIDFDHADDGTPYVVMELLEGESLADRLRRNGPIRDLAEAREILRQICSALSAAHAEHVIHRDLKPSNIFLCGSVGWAPSVRILDFGLSKVTGGGSTWRSPQEGRPLTRVSSILGTPAFMSPEQASGRTAECDPRADLFSLAATVCKMLTGESPFQGGTVSQVLSSVERGLWADSPAWHRLPAALRPVLGRALSPDPERRQGSAAEFWDDLSPALAVSPVAGKRSKLVPRRRLPRALGLGALVLVTAAAGTGLVLLALGPDRSGQEAWLPSPGAARPALVTVARPGTAAAAPSPVPASRPLASTIASAPAAPRSDRPARAHRPLTARARVTTGSLVVQSKSKRDGRSLWADVFLDGRKVGQSALTLEAVPRGRHRVEVRRPGFRPLAREVRVSPGRRVSLLFELEPEAASPLR